MKHLRAALATLFSAIAEKNRLKQLEQLAPITLSAGRVVILAVATIWASVALSRGIDGWPMATLGIALVFAWPIHSALEQIAPQQVSAFAERVLERFGVGATPTSVTTRAEERGER